MADFHFKQRRLTGGLEPVEGDGVAVGDRLAIQTRNFNFKGYEGKEVETQVDKDGLGNDETYKVEMYNGIDFEVLLAGSGAKDTPPAWGWLMQSCGFSEEIDLTAGAECVSYQPISGGYKSAALYLGLPPTADPTKIEQHASTGCRGTVAWSLKAGELPTLKFSSIMGGWHPPEEVERVLVDKSAWKQPRAVSKLNTPKLVITLPDGSKHETTYEEFSGEIGNEVGWRDQPGIAVSEITGRSPKAKLSIPKTRLAALNIYQLIQSHNGVQHCGIKARHGTEDGHIIEVELPKVQLSLSGESDSKGVTYIQIDVTPLESVDGADDDLFIRLPYLAS